MKKLISMILCVVLVGMLLTGCTSDSRWEEEAYQETLLQQANGSVGMPNITNFFEKQMAKEIFELRDDSSLICYAYNINLEGRYVYIGQCMGYGLPYSTQYTCPDSLETSGATLPQADPNGLYSSDSTAATWLYLIDETTGEPQITYMESELTVSQSKVPARLCAAWSLPANY